MLFYRASSSLSTILARIIPFSVYRASLTSIRWFDHHRFVRRSYGNLDASLLQYQNFLLCIFIIVFAKNILPLVLWNIMLISFEDFQYVHTYATNVNHEPPCCLFLCTLRSRKTLHSSLDDFRFSIFKFYLHFHIPRCVLLLNKEFLTSFQRSFSVSSCPISFGHGVRQLVA